MMRLGRLSLTMLSFGLALCAFAVDGMFQGRVVAPPADAPHVAGWIFVQGGNHTLRRVEVSHARITYGEEVPAELRRKCEQDCIEPGQVVLITAEQDSSGEWRAKEVEILRLRKNGDAPAQRISISIYKSLPPLTGVAG